MYQREDISTIVFVVDGVEAGCHLFFIFLILYLVSRIEELYQSGDILSGHLTAGDASR